MTDCVLDTHIWIWLGRNDEALGPKLGNSLQRTAASGRLLVPAISVWELGMLASKGRIALNQSVQSWVRAALAPGWIDVVPLSPDIAIECTQLPGTITGDPADRMIAATARTLDLPLATRDKRLRAYAQQGHLRLLEE